MLNRQQQQAVQRLNGALADASECDLFGALDDAESVDWQAVHAFIDAVAVTARQQRPPSLTPR